MGNAMATSALSIRRRPALRIGHLSLGRILAWTTLGLLLLVTLFPFWWVLRTALSSQREALATPNSLAPVGPTLINFERVLGLVSTAAAQAAGGSGQNLQFFLYLRNSIIFAVLVVVGQLFFSSLAAYAFARLEFPLR